MIGLVLVIGLMTLPQEISDLSPDTIRPIGDWVECMNSNVSRVSQSSDSAEVAADGLLEYCRALQRTARAAISVDLKRQFGPEGEEMTNSLETVLLMRARQNILDQIAAERQH